MRDKAIRDRIFAIQHSNVMKKKFEKQLKQVKSNAKLKLTQKNKSGLKDYVKDNLEEAAHWTDDQRKFATIR